MIVIGIVSCLLLTGFLIATLWTAKYILEAQHLYVKGVNNGYKVDVKIPYKDILRLVTFNFNKVEQICIYFWKDGKADFISLPAPHPHRKQKFIRHILDESEKYNLAHIISPKYITDSRNGVMIKTESCSFVDYCQLAGNLLIALVQDENRVILLGNCSFYDKNEIIQTTPPETLTVNYVFCDFIYILHLDYASVNEALGDVKWDALRNREIRAVDQIAYNHWCTPRT